MHIFSLVSDLSLTFGLFFQELSVTDDTVLEEHNEDPSLVQMKLIGDGGKELLLSKHTPSLVIF